MYVAYLVKFSVKFRGQKIQLSTVWKTVRSLMHSPVIINVLLPLLRAAAEKSSHGFAVVDGMIAYRHRGTKRCTAAVALLCNLYSRCFIIVRYV